MGLLDDDLTSCEISQSHLRFSSALYYHNPKANKAGVIARLWTKGPSVCFKETSVEIQNALLKTGNVKISKIGEIALRATTDVEFTCQEMVESLSLLSVT